MHVHAGNMMEANVKSMKVETFDGSKVLGGLTSILLTGRRAQEWSFRRGATRSSRTRASEIRAAGQLRVKTT
eukprot:2029625-Heterocapsa_arctica.AAC.1